MIGIKKSYLITILFYAGFVSVVYAGDIDGQRLLQKLNSLDESFLHDQTIVVEMDYPEFSFQWGYKGTSRRRVTLTSNEGGMAVEYKIRYLSEPSYRKGADQIDYDMDGNYLVWRDTSSCSILENDLHARRREHMLIRVTPQGKLIEEEGAPVVDFYKPADLTMTFKDFMLPIFTTGRGFSKHLSRITEVELDRQSGLISFRANGSFGPKSQGTWEISVDPEAAYLVRSASFTSNRKASASFVCMTTGTKWYDTMCLAEKAMLNTSANNARLIDYFITSATKEFKPQADVALFKRARSLFRRPLPMDTAVFDFQVSPPGRYTVGRLPMTDRELLDVVADAEPIIEDANHAAPEQASAVSDSNGEEIYLTKYEPGSLVYAVDQYVKEEQESIKLISSETFQDSLSRMCDWNSNYYKLTIQNYESAPAIPSSLKLILYSRRFAKLIEHGNSGFTDKEISGIIQQLGSDLIKWKKVYAGGQSLRDKTLYFYKKDKSSEELILPLSYRINASILLMGQFSIKEGLPVILETAETFGEDTNWSAVGYACDKILTSLNQDSLSSERRKIVNDYQTWRQSEKQKILDYEVIELPSYQSPLRPFERATSLGANLDLSKGTINIEMPPQYIYLMLRDGAGYHDLRGNSEILKKVISFAKVYNEAKN